MKSNSGFSLIEVMISMVIGAVVFLAIAQLQVSNIKNNVTVTNMAAAKHIGASAIANITNTFTKLNESTITNEVIGDNTTFVVVTNIKKVNETVMNINTIVSWNDYNEPQKVELATMAHTSYTHHKFVPKNAIPSLMSCVDKDRGHGNDFWHWDVDNRGKSKKAAQVGVEAVCEDQ